MSTSRPAVGSAWLASARSMPRTASTLPRSSLKKRRRAMTDEDDHIARSQRPPRKGQFKPGQSGNLSGRPPGSKNIRTYVKEHLNKKIPIIEGGKTRKVSRAEAIAIQLVNRAAKGEPKDLAAIMSLEGIIARIRAGDPSPSPDPVPESSNANASEEPNPTEDPDPDAES